MVLLRYSLFVIWFFMSAEQSLFIRTLKGEAVERTPVWMMRQAGRYLPEYRATRAKAGNFMNLCKTPSLACEVTLQPLARFSLDAAILFSDILTIPDAMGLGLSFEEGEGPRFARPLRTELSIKQLHEPNISRDLDYVFDAVALIRRELPKDLPLIGFTGSPWTLACYMVEGGGSRDFKHILPLLYSTPHILVCLLEKLTRSIIDYLDEQVKAGANALMIFDTWGGILTPFNYLQYSLHYMTEIVQALKIKHPEIPVILFTKGGGHSLEAMAQSGCAGLGLDWTCDLTSARQRVGDKVVLQGNLDPSVLLTHPECIRQEVQRVLASFGQGSGHIFNLGHGITPDVLPEHAGAMIDAVHEFSPAFHRT